jgi:chemotaxis protein MotB
MAGHGGGAWKVAYADFVTAMMAFFLVMWITSQNDEVKEAVQTYFQDPWGYASDQVALGYQVPGQGPGAGKVPGRVPDRRMQSMPPPDPNNDSDPPAQWAQQLDIHFLSNTDRTLPALVVRFEEGSAKLTPQAQDQLAALMPVLIGKLNMIEVRAHSTRRPLSSRSGFEDHWRLCYERSLTLMKFLEEHGVEPERIRLSQAAANEPLTTRYETALQKENDRVELFLLDTVAAELPGTEATLSTDAKDHKTTTGGSEAE